MNIVPFQAKNKPVKPEPILFAKQLRLILGEACWGIVAGKGAGSVVSLKLGCKSAKKKPAKNQRLTEDERNYDPAFSLLVFSAWRLSNSAGVICGWRDCNDKDSVLIRGLENLRHACVIEVQLNPISYDLTLCFEGGLIFEIFCDITGAHDADDNYYFFTPTEVYTVGMSSELLVEERVFE